MRSEDSYSGAQITLQGGGKMVEEKEQGSMQEPAVAVA